MSYTPPLDDGSAGLDLEPGNLRFWQASQKLGNPVMAGVPIFLVRRNLLQLTPLNLVRPMKPVASVCGQTGTKKWTMVLSL